MFSKILTLILQQKRLNNLCFKVCGKSKKIQKKAKCLHLQHRNTCESRMKLLNKTNVI